MREHTLLGLLGAVNVVFIAWKIANHRQCDDATVLAQSVSASSEVEGWNQCDYRNELPADAGSFYSEITLPGRPVVFRNGWKLNGEAMSGWNSTRHLLQTFGEQPFEASVFNVHRANEAFTQPTPA